MTTTTPPPPNFANRTIWTGDCLDIMRGMNSSCVDLIYLDPPFNSKRDYAAPIGSRAAQAEFKDTWTLSDINVEWIKLIEAKEPRLHRVLLATMTDSDKSYLTYMAVRILEMRRVLKPTGSIYLHCDPTMSHYLKLVMDAIFGRKAFRNEIVWCYSRPSAPKQRQLSRVHDIILWYSRGDRWTFNPDEIRQPYAELSMARDGYASTASKVAEGTVQLNERGKFPESWIYIPPLKGNSREYVGYPTQKPIALLERILKAGSNEGDMVLDPFCGCATTCVAADALGREWAGVDVSELAADLVQDRINDLTRTIIPRDDIPERTDMGEIPRYNAPTNKTKLYGEQEGNCAGCKTHFELRNLEVDHITSKSRGGTDHISNLQLLCGSCNRVKGERGMDYLFTKLWNTARDDRKQEKAARTAAERKPKAV